MRTTGKGLYKFLKEQESVRWPGYGGGLIVYFRYNGFNCAGIITKHYCGRRLVASNLTIRPIQSVHDIGNGAGNAVYKDFLKDANKKP